MGPHQRHLVAAGQADLQTLGDRPGDLLLDREHILGLAVEPLRPEVIPIRHIDELRGDPQLCPCLTHAALEHRAHREFVPDDAQILTLPLERERGRPTRHSQPRQLSEGVDDLFRNAVAEVLDLRVGAHVGEREHGDRLVGRRFAFGRAPRLGRD